MDLDFVKGETLPLQHRVRVRVALVHLIIVLLVGYKEDKKFLIIKDLKR